MNKTIKALNKKLSKSIGDISEIKSQLQVEWNKVFDDCTAVKTMVAKVENSNEYRTDQYGEIESYVYLNTSDFKDCMAYFKNYMMEFHFIQFDGDCLSYSQGESITIQDDTRRDNGVWLNGKCIIDESEYKDDTEVNETKRNELIEAYMEKHGYFPGVFRADSHGNVFPVSTHSVKVAV